MKTPEIALMIFLGLVMLVVLLIKYVDRLPLPIRGKHHARKAMIEDVLKQLYHVEYSGRRATLNALAGALKISHKKLVSLIELMIVKNLVTTSQNTLHLTTLGRDYALKIIRVHRLWEKYLSEKTGIDKSEWHDHAEQMEHRLSSEEVKQLYLDLGSPRFDPHGDPIPTEKGEIIAPKWKVLSGLQPGIMARIVHIEDEPEVIYRQIIDQKLHIGSQLKIIASDEQQTTFFSEGLEYTLSAVIASNISTLELSEMEIFEEQRVRLSNLQDGEEALILGISSECRGIARRRLMDLGFIKGSHIKTEL
ncbi:MAG: metal-dependent transcriptional regulator, partial [Cyclobacteriaceae bacterium]|nr:metal-dependent transcriptional regulator [Cyclobacteriaceae bacterium]